MPLYCCHPLVNLPFFQCQGVKGASSPFAKCMLSTGLDSCQGLPSSPLGEVVKLSTFLVQILKKNLLYRYILPFVGKYLVISFRIGGAGEKNKNPFYKGYGWIWIWASLTAN